VIVDARTVSCDRIGSSLEGRFGAEIVLRGQKLA
jgi:hypothetical protein